MDATQSNNIHQSPNTQLPQQQQQSTTTTTDPIKGRILQVNRDVEAGTGKVVYSIKLQLLHNNDIRLITDNHVMNKLFKGSKNESLAGSWHGTMLDNNLNNDDIVLLNIISKNQAIWQKVDPDTNLPVNDLNNELKPKKQRKRNLDIDLLLNHNTGLSNIYYKFDTSIFNQKTNNEHNDLKTLLSMYKQWGFKLYSNMNFILLVKKIESLGNSKRMKNWLNNLRSGKLPEQCDQVYSIFDNDDIDISNDDNNDLIDVSSNNNGITPYSKRRKSAHTIEKTEKSDVNFNELIHNDDDEDEQLFVDNDKPQRDINMLNQSPNIINNKRTSVLHNANTVEQQLNNDIEQSTTTVDAAELWARLQNESEDQTMNPLLNDIIVDPFNQQDNDNENVSLNNNKQPTINNNNTNSILHKATSNIVRTDSKAPVQVMSLDEALDDW